MKFDALIYNCILKIRFVFFDDYKMNISFTIAKKKIKTKMI